MFTLLPNATSPGSAWIASHGVLLALSMVALAGFAVMVRFANPRDFTPYGGEFDGSDCSDSDSDGGSCDGGH